MAIGGRGLLATTKRRTTTIVMILEIFSFECYFPRDLLSDFEIQMRIRQRRST